MKDRSSNHIQNMTLVEDSPLRQLDPRTKLMIAICASLMVMLPLNRLVIFAGIYICFLICARLLPATLRQIWRIKWVLLILFVLDFWLINLELATTVALRLIMLAGVFTLLFSTTTPAEFTLAIESLHLPYRYAFSLGLAFQSLGLLEDEWRSIQEAQRARGALRPIQNWRDGLRQIGDLVALTVPAIVLTTKRAWTITELAYTRGFESPKRLSYRALKLQLRDGIAIGLALLTAVSFLFWPMIMQIITKLIPQAIG